MMIARGQALVGVLILLAILLMLVPTLVMNVQNEARWSVKENKSTTAFHQAEAGIDRAVWKLNESSSNWDAAAGGVVFPGFNDDKTYTDVQGGSYRIKISGGAAGGQVKIVATGRDAASKEYRAIEVLYKTSTANAAIHASSLQLSSSIKIFWGPVFALTNIALDSSSDQLFPRKFARASITSGGSYGNRDNAASAPNTDCREYWAYNDATCGSSGVPDMPSVDLDWYRTQAQIAPNLYYTTPQTLSNVQDNVERIRFFEEDVTFTGTTHMRGWIIGMKKVTFDTSGYDDAAYGSYTVSTSSIPATAWKEYQRNTPQKGKSTGGACPSSCENGGDWGATNDGNYYNDSGADADDCCREQYPGDAGLQTVHDFNFKNGCVAHGEKGGHSGEPVSFRGLVHSGGVMKLHSSSVLHGVIIAPGGFDGTSSGIVFYDPTVSIRMISSYSRQYWRAAAAVPW